jgi:signal transduction histidine kinase
MDLTPPGPHEATYLQRIIHNLRSPLVVISGQAQLLARWARRSDHPDAAAVLARLAVIERMVRELDARIMALEEQVEARPGDDEG